MDCFHIRIICCMRTYYTLLYHRQVFICRQVFILHDDTTGEECILTSLLDFRLVLSKNRIVQFSSPTIRKLCTTQKIQTGRRRRKGQFKSYFSIILGLTLACFLCQIHYITTTQLIPQQHHKLETGWQCHYKKYEQDTLWNIIYV